MGHGVRVGPGTIAPGTLTPGTVTPGTVTPGIVTPGTVTPEGVIASWATVNCAVKRSAPPGMSRPAATTVYVPG